MKRLTLVSLVLGLLLNVGCTPEQIGSVLGSQGPLTQAEIVDGLKEALTIGSGNAATSLNRTDAFFANGALKIPFPPKAKAVETTLRRIGAGRLADDVVLSLNRAAEDAAIKSKPIFLDAIRSITFADALGILRGGPTSATNYLHGKTFNALIAAFREPIRGSLEKVGATRYWGDAVSLYIKVPLVEPIDPDLTAYVTTKALDGLFTVVGQEEANIRANPAARVTDILRRVFGSADQRHFSTIGYVFVGR